MLRGNTEGGAGMKRVMATICLGAALGLAACAPVERGVGGVFENMAALGGRLGAPWGNTEALGVADGITVARVRAGSGLGGAEPLLPEDGNVWPAAEGPRATLANPDEALRGIPSYRPGVDSAVPPATERPRRRARGSDAAYEPPPNQPSPAVTSVPPLGMARQPLAGSSVIAPDGSSRVITGGSGNVGSTISPTGQTGVVLRDGNMQILQEPGRPAQQVIIPR